MCVDYSADIYLYMCVCVFIVGESQLFKHSTHKHCSRDSFFPAPCYDITFFRMRVFGHAKRTYTASVLPFFTSKQQQSSSF